MLERKAFTIVYEDWGDEINDFYISFQVDIGPRDIIGASDMFSFNVVSTTRLRKIIEYTELEVGRGYLIMNEYNLARIQETVDRIIKKCEVDDILESMKNLSRYFRWEMDN